MYPRPRAEDRRFSGCARKLPPVGALAFGVVRGLDLCVAFLLHVRIFGLTCFVLFVCQKLDFQNLHALLAPVAEELEFLPRLEQAPVEPFVRVALQVAAGYSAPELLWVDVGDAETDFRCLLQLLDRLCGQELQNEALRLFFFLTVPVPD